MATCTNNHLPAGETTRRRGAILIAVLTCLMVAAALFVLVVRQVGNERQAIDAEYRGLQAAWLAEAGVERAAARLAAQADYAGETWAIPAAELAADECAVVRIVVKPIAGQPEQRSVNVEADYPDMSNHRCRQLKQVVVDRNGIRTHK
jgi:type II secretory pathway component PulK